jgi:hypothetical protein
MPETRKADRKERTQFSQAAKTCWRLAFCEEDADSVGVRFPPSPLIEAMGLEMDARELEEIV